MIYKINPDRTKPFNDLPELPIEESLYKDFEVYEKLISAKSALARLNGRSIAIPNQGLLINSISLQEAKASSEIENIFTTDDELYKAYSEENVKELIGPEKEILNYREALWEGFEQLQKQPQFNENYFVKMYQTLSSFSDGIRSPIAQIYIKEGGSGPNAGKAFYTPPRGAGIVEKKLENLIEFINDDEKYKLDPLLKMAIAHFQFEAIHPFRDGNGRTGRLFNIHFLNNKGLLDYPILFLSKYIIDHKEEYYSGLAGITQRGSWKTWFLYILQAIETTSNLTFDKINDIVAAKDAILEALVNNTSISRPESLVSALFNQPFTKVKHLTEKGLYAENTARKYLEELVGMKILEKRKIQGNHYYLNLELYRILSE